MRSVWLLAVASAIVPAAFGQGIDWHSITIGATRSIYVAPDEAQFYVSVASLPTASLDDVLAYLEGTPLTASNLASVQSQQVTGGDQLSLQWSFTWSVPVAQAKDVVLKLLSLQTTLSSAGKFRASYYLQSLNVSDKLRAAQSCPWTNLVNDATVRAQQLTSAAGLTLGPIIGLSDQLSTSTVARFISIAAFAPVSSSPALTCSMAVKFSLLP